MDLAKSISSLNIVTSSSDVEDSRLIVYFKNASIQTVEKYCSYIKFSLFKEHYPDLHKTNSADLKLFHTQLKSQLRLSFLESIDEVCTESNLFPSLSLLDNIIEKNSKVSKIKAWRPSGTPNEDMRNRIHRVKLTQKKSLEFILQTFLTENDTLEKVMMQNHKEILSIKRKINSKNEEIEKHLSDREDPKIIELQEELQMRRGDVK